MKRSPLLFLLAFVIMLASCKNGTKGDLFIPKDAAMVFHISTSSLSNKLSWDEIKKTTWFQDAYNQSSTDSFAKQLMDNPEASGIDVKSDFVFFMKKRGRGGFNVFEGSVKDAAAFEALLKRVTKKDKVEKDGDWNVMVTDDNSVAMWNSSKFAVINNMPLGNINPMGGKMDQTNFGADSLRVFGKQIMTLDGDESLYDDDRFASVMKDGGDMHFWMNSGAFYSDMAGMMSMMKIGALFQDNISAGTISFEDGKIAARMKQFFGKEMQKAMEDWKFKDVDASVLNRIPSQNVIGVMAMNMDPQGLKEFFKTIGVDGFINMFLSEQNLTMDDVISATKGEFVVAVSDLQMKDTTMTFASDSGEKPMTFTTRKPDMDIIFATSVNQKNSFDKVLNTFKKESPEMPFTYQLTNEWFVAGNKPATINSFVAGGNAKHAFTDKISGHPFGFYLDIQRLLRTNFTKDTAAKTMLEESATIWKDVVAIGNNFKDGVMSSEIVVNMVDTKTNSLKQLNQFIEKLNATRKANKVAMGDDRNITIDSAIVTPPAVVDED